MSEYINVSEIFGEDVFNDSVMQQRLPKKVYKDYRFLMWMIDIRHHEI